MSVVGAASLASSARTNESRLLTSLIVPAAELLIVLGLMEIDLWYLRGTDQPLLHAMVFVTIAVAIWYSVRRRQLNGLAATGGSTAARAWGEGFVLTACVTLVLFATAWLFRDRDEGFRFFFRQRPPSEWLVWVTVRIVGAVVQQLGLQLFIGPVCREIVRRGFLGIGAAGLLFGILHLPHPILVAITVIMGSLWVWLYGRSGRLAPVVVCHAVLSLLAAGTLPKSVISDMDIGRYALNQMINPRYLCTEDVGEAVELVRTQSYYVRQGGTPRGFIEGIYRDFLDRGPSQEELDKWLIELSENSRARTALSMFKSRGFERVRVRAIARNVRAVGTDEVARGDPDDSVRR